MKEFGGDNTELYIEEKEAREQQLIKERSQIPGLAVKQEPNNYPN